MTQSRVVCHKCQNSTRTSVMKCVCVCVWHRVCSVCVCLVDCSTQSSDIPPDSSELFTVPGLSESEKEGKREVR